MVLAFEFFCVGCVIVIILGIIVNVQGEHTRAQQMKVEQAHFKRQERDNQDWRKVGVMTSYYNRGMMELQHRQKCPICGRENPRSGDSVTSTRPCPTCEKRYKQDVHDGIFPPGIAIENRYTYDARDYYALRLIEYELKSGEISEAEAHDKHEALIESINARAQHFAELRARMSAPLNTSYRDDYLS